MSIYVEDKDLDEAINESIELLKENPKGNDVHKRKMFLNDIIRQFAEELMNIFDTVRSEEEKKFKEYFGVEKEDIKLLVEQYLPFQRNQAIFALNRFINSKCDNVILENYDEDKMPPIYESIETKRDAFVMLVSMGYFFFTYKDKKFMIDLYFNGTARFYRLWFKSEYEKEAIELQKEITNFFKKFNFFRGEKLNFLQQGNLEFLQYPELGWSDVILSPEIKEEFMLNIIFPLENEESCKLNGIPWRRGLMLGGKAGTGKTQVCRVLCSELPKNVTLIWTTPKALYDEHTIQLLFDAARFFSPTLIIIEDIDFIGLSRDFARNPILGELLTQLDGNDPNDGIFVIATTNRPELLDEALANRPSRFDVQILFELPNPEQRKQIIELFSKNMEFGELLNMNVIVEATKDLSGSHIKEIFVHCQLAALKTKTKVMNKDILTKAEHYKKNLIKNGKDMIR